MPRRSYGQYCAVAKALDHVGDRWTLLIVRELLMGPRRYSDLRASLPGIATNLLARRLRELAADGIIVRGGSRGSYELTEFGRGLENVIHELVRWGGRWMGQRAQDEVFEPEWLAVALTALFPDHVRGRVEIRADDVVLTVNQGRARVGAAQDPEAVVEGPPETVLAVAAGRLPLSAVTVRGDHGVAAALLGREQGRGPHEGSP